MNYSADGKFLKKTITITQEVRFDYETELAKRDDLQAQLDAQDALLLKFKELNLDKVSDGLDKIDGN